MTNIDTAALRAKYPKERDNSLGADDIRALCDALDAARAELKACHGNPVAGNPGEWPHVDQIEGLSTQAAKWYRAQPVVEAARAWVAWGLRRKGSELLQDNNLDTAMRVANELEAAVAAYQAGEKP